MKEKNKYTKLYEFLNNWLTKYDSAVSMREYYNGKLYNSPKNNVDWLKVAKESNKYVQEMEELRLNLYEFVFPLLATNEECLSDLEAENARLLSTNVVLENAFRERNRQISNTVEYIMSCAESSSTRRVLECLGYSQDGERINGK